MATLKRIVTGLVSVSVVGGILAGCGTGGSPSTASGNGSGSNGGASGSDANLPKGQTITVWSWQGGPELADVKKIAQAWATQHGDTVQVVDQSQNPNHFQYYATSARAGKGPDIVFGMPHDNNGLFAEEGLMAKVPSGIVDNSQYQQSVVDAVTVNGTLYSVPVSVQTTALFYNTKMIPTAPTDWNTFVQDANAHGFMYDQANLYNSFALVGGMGGYVFKNNNGTLDPNDIGLGNSGAIQAYQIMSDMDNKYHWMKPTVNGTIALANFTAGKIGMYVSGPWDIPNIEKAKIPYAIAPWPTLPNGKPGTPFMGVITAFVSSKSKTQNADWSLVTALSNSTAQTEYFKDAQQIPALNAAQQDPSVQGNQYFKAFTDAIPNAVPMPNIPQMQAVWTAMSVLNNVVSGKTSPEQAGKDLVANIKKGIAVQGN